MLIMSELSDRHVIKTSFLCHKSLVRPLFKYSSMLKKYNLIAFLYCTQAMSHHHSSTIKTIQIITNFPLTDIIQCACCFIKEHNLRSVYQGSGNKYSLLLSSTKATKAFTDNGMHLHRHLTYIISYAS